VRVNPAETLRFSVPFAARAQAALNKQVRSQPRNLLKDPLIEMERKEQALLFGELRGDPNGQMALFKVNTGLREQEVCNLQWE
jgi:hypothetical protein